MPDYVRLHDMQEAHRLVENHHYSHRAVRNSSICGALLVDGVVEAACFFYSPATRWSEPVLELCRLVRTPALRIPLTGLISFSANEAKREGFDLLISFADKTKDHHGGVYQAASWAYHGARRPSCDGFLIDGKFTPRRSCNEKYGTSSYTELIERLPEATIERHIDAGKHLYWRALSKSGHKKAASLKLKCNPYPKPLGREAAELLS